MKQSELLAEVEALVQQAIDEDCEVPASWLTQTVIAAHADIEGGDSDFYVLCAYNHVPRTVASVLRRYREDAEDEAAVRQPTLPGFKRLQPAYLIEREGVPTLVPVLRVTVSELRTKAAEYRRMGTGCYEHADELERLAAERESA